MAPKRKAQFELDPETEEKLDDIRKAFSNAVYEFYEQVGEGLDACVEAREEPELDEEKPDEAVDNERYAANITEADNHALSTMTSLLLAVQNTEKPMSELWVECRIRHRRAANLSEDTFEQLHESFKNDRKDIDETIATFKSETEDFDLTFREAIQKPFDDYRKAQAVLLGNELAAQRSEPSD